MTRAQFEIAYREARCIYRTFLEFPDRNGRKPTHSEKVGAEEQWIAGCKGPKRIAFLALAACGPRTWLSNGATYCYRNNLYNERSAFPGWVREALARRMAA